MSNDVIAREFEENETWMNAVQGIVVVKKIGETGRTVDLPVRGGTKFQLTPRERRINHEAAYSPEQDVFKNGVLQPVKLLEDEKDVAEIQSNPNIIGEAEMKALFGEHWKTFEKRVGEIHSPAVLHRMVAISKDPSVNASVRSVESLKARLAQVDPEISREPEAEEIEDLG